MAKYMVTATYTADGVKGLLSDGGSKRRAGLENTLKGMGASLEAFYFAFGVDDVVTIIDAPDNVSVAAVSLAIGASGAVSTRTTVLLTPEEIDEAAKRTVEYRPPGA